MFINWTTLISSFSLHQFIMSVLHSSSFVLLIVAVAIFSEIHRATANKTVSCDVIPCKDENEICYLGKCIKDTPCDHECPPGEECYWQIVQCFTTPCPPVKSCRPKKCTSGNCPDGEVYYNGNCVVDDKCPVTLCLKGTYCYLGQCLKEVPCKEGQCCPAEKCYVGSECSHSPCHSNVVCIYDKCATVRCSAGHNCEHGKCIPVEEDKCALIDCRSGYICKDGQCILHEDKCAVIRCRSGYICKNGQCIPVGSDKCATVKCSSGYHCEHGACVPSDECIIKED